MIAVLEYVNGMPKNGGDWTFLDNNLEFWIERWSREGLVIPAAFIPGEPPNLQFFRFVTSGGEDRIFAVDINPSGAQEC